MLKRLLHFITPDSGKLQHHIIPREKHNLSKRNISRAALKVMERLQEEGYEGYLVGGGVRDGLLGGHPKDFDVATNATPEQVKRLFRNSRIIGRRFKIVHVRFGREIIEVTTFRGHHDDSKDSKRSKQSSDGMLLRDNVYGDIRSDALRRDFTINALYYTSDHSVIHDYTGGMQDLARRKLRMIGDPQTRYQEDPVRMLRAVRFAAKLDFEIEKKTAAPIFQQAQLLGNIPSARLFDETLKLFMGGKAKDTFFGLQEYGLLHYLIPVAAAEISGGNPITNKLYAQALENTDKRIRNNQRVTPAFLYAALLWPAVVKEQQRLEQDGEHPVKAHHEAAQNIISSQIQHTAIPKRFTQAMREIWDMQSRLPRRQGKQAERLVEHQRFRAAYDFLLLREQAGEDHQGLGQWWTDYQDADEASREAMVAQLSRNGSPSKRKRRRGPRKSNQQQGE